MSEVRFSESETTFKGAEQNCLAATLFEPENSRNGPVALLMHGGGQTRHSWNGTARKLAMMGLTAITADARGHGGSDWLESKNYSFMHYAEDLIVLAKAVRERFGRAPILIGASLGGVSAMIAQQEACPDLFEAIVLVDITPRMEPSGVERIQGFMAKDMRKGFASVKDAAKAIAAYLPHRKKPKSLDGLRKNLRRRDDGRWYWHWDPGFIEGPMPIETGRAERPDVLYEAARKITVPTLLVRGARSELVTEEAAQEFLELVPHAKFADVSDAGHMVAGDSNEIFAEAVMKFLRTDVLREAA